MAATANFTVIKGDTFRKTPIFRRKSTKAPIDLTGAVITGSVNGINLNCSIINGPAGQFRFELLNTQQLTTGVNKYEVVCVYADNTIQTLLNGNLVVEA